MSLHPVTMNVPTQPGGRVIALRRMAMHYTELPKYLLAPEVSALLHYLPDWTQHGLINTLWNTGACINDDIPHVVIRTAKQRCAGGGHPAKGKLANRVGVLSDADYVREMRNLFASTRERFEVDALTGEKRAMPVWNVTKRTGLVS